MTSRRSIIVSLMLGLFLSLFSLLEANAQVPRSISYQGQLKKSGQAYTGTVNMDIKIYNAGGQELYTETYTGVAVTDGIFNVQLGGNDNHLPGDLKFDQQYFLGINIDGAGELSPRTPFVAAPYALNSQTVGGFGASAVPTPGMLLPLDANGKIPVSVLPQASQIPLETINLVPGDATGNITLTTNTPADIAITTNQATNTIFVDYIGTSGGTITSVQAGPGLTGGGSSGVVTIGVANNGITTAMLGTGVVTGIKLDQFVAGLGLVQDALGNLNINYDATLQIVGDVLGLNLGNPNTWTALQTFNAGITVNGTLTLNGAFVHTGNTTQVGDFMLDGNLVVTGTSDLQGGVFNSTGDFTVNDNLHVTGNSDLDGTLNVDGISTTNGVNNTGDINNTGNFNQVGNINNTGVLTNDGDANFNVGGAGTFTINGVPEPFAPNAGAVTNFEAWINGDLSVVGFTNLQGNTQVNGTFNVLGNSIFNGIVNLGTLDQQGAIFNTSGNNGGAVFVGDNFTVNGNSNLTGNNTIGTPGSSVNLITGANNTYTATGLNTFNGNVLMNNNFTLLGASNSYGVDARPGVGTISNNQFNGINFFGNIGVNGNKVLINGLATLGAPTAPTGFPGGFSSPTDFEGVVNGDFQVTGFTHLNNATVNGTLMIMGSIISPAATACFNTVQVANLASWCGGPAGASIGLQTAFNQSSLGTSANNLFLSTNISGNLTVTGNLDAQNTIFNSTGNNSGNVAVNDGFQVSGNSQLNGMANTFGPVGAGGTSLVLNPIAITPPIGNEVTPNSTNTMRGHDIFVGSGAGLNERKIFVHGVPEGPGAIVPNNSVPPVTNFEVEIVGDLYVQGTIVGGGIPQIASYSVTLVPGSGPNGGGSVSFAPAGGYDANDAVHMSYTNFGTAQGYLVYDSPAANTVRIESSSALDNANLRVTIIRYP